MSPKGVKRTNLVFTERFEPDPRRVEEGLAILGRMLAQAYARDAPNNGHIPSAIPNAEESAVVPQKPRDRNPATGGVR